jgi:hypothetical protein
MKKAGRYFSVAKRQVAVYALISEDLSLLSKGFLRQNNLTEPYILVALAGRIWYNMCST